MYHIGLYTQYTDALHKSIRVAYQFMRAVHYSTHRIVLYLIVYVKYMYILRW